MKRLPMKKISTGSVSITATVKTLDDLREFVRRTADYDGSGGAVELKIYSTGMGSNEVFTITLLSSSEKVEEF